MVSDVEPLYDGRWHSLQLERNGAEMRLLIDDER